jgi:hypothetical protein
MVLAEGNYSESRRPNTYSFAFFEQLNHCVQRLGREVGSDAEDLQIEAATVEQSAQILIVFIVSAPRRPENATDKRIEGTSAVGGRR